MGWLAVIGIIAGIAFFSWVVGNWRKARKYEELKPRLDNVEAAELNLKNKQVAWERKVQSDVEAAELNLKNKQVAWERKIQNDVEAVNTLAKEKSQGFPWLAKAYSDYFHLQKLKEANYLQYKSHPAPTTAEKVRNIARERRAIEEKLRIAQGIINYYQDFFPFLEEFLGEPDEEVLKQVLSQSIEKPIQEVGELGVDPVRVYLSSLSKEEYQKLSPSERNQLALDKYWNRPKTNWQLGRDYERYIGYRYEANGYNVYYQGILEGFDDLGRDLICKKGKQTTIIQCKRWSQHKTIHEKHVNQLYGTFVKYKIDHPDEEVNATLYTTTKLSDRAKEFAAYLNVLIAEEFPLNKYPSIKCNISRRNNERIYHLPFDQQYDRTLVEEERNECYAATVQEAENLGYRRAWRWQG